MNDDPAQPDRPVRGPVDPAHPVILPPDADVEVDVVREQERTRVLPDGTRVREVDRVEHRSRVRELLPWILIALLLVLLLLTTPTAGSAAAEASWVTE